MPTLNTKGTRVRVIVTSDKKSYDSKRESIIRERLRGRSTKHTSAYEPSVQRLNKRMEQV